VKEKRILVTGGTGVLGCYIVEALLADGWTDIEVMSRGGRSEKVSFSDDSRVTYTAGDVTELYPLLESVERASYIIHTAAIVSFHPSRYKLMHAVNVDGTANVVNAALEANVEKLIHVSSVAAIGKDDKHKEITEETQWTNSDNNAYYGVTKYLAEQEVWRAHVEGLNMAIVNPSVVLGGQAWDQSSLKLFSKAYDGIPYYPIGSTGIVDARDVALITLHLLKSEVSGERYIAAAENVSYKDLFQIMTSAMGRKGPTKPAPRWIMEIMWRVEKFRSFFSNNEPIVTKATVKRTGLESIYVNDKSKSLGWGEYRPASETIEHFAKAYKAFREG